MAIDLPIEEIGRIWVELLTQQWLLLLEKVPGTRQIHRVKSRHVESRNAYRSSDFDSQRLLLRLFTYIFAITSIRIYSKIDILILACIRNICSASTNWSSNDLKGTTLKCSAAKTC